MNESPTTSQTTVDFRGITGWYQSHCDDSWEHQYGIRLETLDNPGWHLTVDLIHTDLQGRTMADVCEGVSPEEHPTAARWIHCFVRNNKFEGACDPTQVARLFETFTQFSGASVARPI
jgi:Immunity protein 53